MFYSGMSDIGRKRASNQDTFRIIELGSGEKPASVLLAVVCDGMGGMNGGNVASQLAVESFTASFTSSYRAAKERYSDDDDIIRPFTPSKAAQLRAAADSANREVMKRAAADSSLEGMGTTLTAAFIADNKMYIANVGDSRLYTVCGDNIHRVTKDHSYVQYLIDAGELEPEDAENSPYRSIITRAVGRENTLDTDIYTVPLGSFDGYILMCSDGLYNFLPEDEIAMVINSAVKGTAILPDGMKANSMELAAKVETLVARANENGGGDNITAVLIRCRGTETGERTDREQ